jgi:hypothetical protein
VNEAVWAFYANGRSALFGFARLERRIAFQAREPPFEGAKEAKDYGSTFDLSFLKEVWTRLCK